MLAVINTHFISHHMLFLCVSV